MPKTIQHLWQAWSRLARQIGNLQARILLTIVYAVVVLPFGVRERLFGDPLRMKKRPGHWVKHPDDRYDLEWARRQ
jgi:hypothetical protein